jgi:hypothetical protein
MAPNADNPFVPAHLAVLDALYRRRRALEARPAGRPVTIATTSPTGSDDAMDRYVVDLKIDAAEGMSCAPRLPLDDVVLADVECQRDNTAIRQYGDKRRRRAFLGVEYG